MLQFASDGRICVMLVCAGSWGLCPPVPVSRSFIGLDLCLPQPLFLSVSPLLSLCPSFFDFPPMCEYCAWALPCVSLLSLSSIRSWWESHMVCLATDLADPYSSICLQYNLCTQHVLHMCPSWDKNPSSVALPEVASILFPVVGV